MSTADDPIGMAALLSAMRPTLVKEWRKVFGHPAPRSAQIRLLRGVLAWRHQAECESHGVVRQLTRQLRNWSARAPVASLRPGTKLLREWKGQTHHVTVLNEGFEYDSKHYKSLTAIARKITGMGWSGPHFFGLRK